MAIPDNKNSFLLFFQTSWRFQIQIFSGVFLLLGKIVIFDKLGKYYFTEFKISILALQLTLSVRNALTGVYILH